MRLHVQGSEYHALLVLKPREKCASGFFSCHAMHQQQQGCRTCSDARSGTRLGAQTGTRTGAIPVQLQLASSRPGSHHWSVRLQCLLVGKQKAQCHVCCYSDACQLAAVVLSCVFDHDTRKGKKNKVDFTFRSGPKHRNTLQIIQVLRFAT